MGRGRGAGGGGGGNEYVRHMAALIDDKTATILCYDSLLYELHQAKMCL